jgi:hypothetical protein
VKNINKLYPIEIEKFPEADEPDDFFWDFCYLLIDIVSKIPYNHPKQERIFRFLMTLRESTNKPLTMEGITHQVWRDLPVLGQCWREFFYIPESPSPEDHSKWLSLNSFAARLTGEGVLEGIHLALYQLRIALEEENVTREDANSNISVASVWIIRSGLRLYLKSRNTVLPEKPRMQETGSLYGGPSGLCPERWQFWKLRFSKVMDEVDEEVAKMVRQAIDRMEFIEKNFGKRRDLDLYTVDRPLKSRKTAV